MSYLAESTSSANPSGVLLLLVLLGVLLWAGVARSRRNTDRCAQHGHVVDPKSVGRWTERCARCGARL